MQILKKFRLKFTYIFIQIKNVTEEYSHIFLYIDWKNDDITIEQFQRICTDTEQKLNQIRTNLEKLIVEQCQFEQGIKSNNSYFETFLKYQNVETLDRLILLDLVEKIYITKDKTIQIEFKFKD